MRFRVAILLVLTIASTALFGKDITYEQGKIVRIEPLDQKVPIPLNSRTAIMAPLERLYLIQIRAGDVTYFADCEKNRYKPEWHVNDQVRFRIEKRDLFLLRPNGKELRFRFTKYTPPPPK